MPPICNTHIFLDSFCFMLEQLLNMTNAGFNNKEKEGDAGMEVSGSSCSLMLLPGGGQVILVSCTTLSSLGRSIWTQGLLFWEQS